MFLQQCPHCAHVNPTGSRFCNACGGPLDLAPCPHCGAINAAGDVACHECGARLTVPVERPSPAPPRERPQPSPHVLHQTVPQRPQPNESDAGPHVRPRNTPRLIAGGLVALVLLAIGYALSLRSTLEREAAPATAARVATPPTSPAASPSPPSKPAERGVDGPPPPDAAKPAAEANACPPAVAAMDLCRSRDAAARRN